MQAVGERWQSGVVAVVDLPAKFQPYHDGNFQIGAALGALFGAILTGVVDSLYAGVGGVVAGLMRPITNGLHAFASFWQDFVELLFATSTNYDWGDPIAQLDLFGVLGYVAGIAVVVVLLYVTTRAATTVAGWA